MSTSRPNGAAAVSPLVLVSLAALQCVGPTPPNEGVTARTGEATVPSGFIDEVFEDGLSTPTAMEFAPDGRLFVAQQGGALRVIKDRVLLAAPFLTVSVDQQGERGLLGIAFDPAFASNQFVYIYYTTLSGGVHNRVSRFTANGDVAVAGSEVVLMELEPLNATNHNGGAIHFGADGKLYVAVGENALGSNAQTLANRLGKMLRINADGTIPTDNPFFTMATGVNRSIWARGLRNPFTFAFQPGTGRMHINDVGETRFEEIDLGAAGANYGWPHAEGPVGNVAGDTPPIHSIEHLNGVCSIAGGAFYNPPMVQFPSAWVGHYFFADFCAGWIRRLDPQTGTAFDFASAILSPVDLKVGSDGAVYYLARGANIVGRIRATTAPQAPIITVQPASQTVSAGAPATFSVSASGTQPLAYQWQRNGANIAGAASSSFTLASTTTADSGAQFRVIVSNSVGSVTSNAATLTVLANAPPMATITAPAAESLYAAGQTITYAGSGNDPETGALPPSAFTWQIDFHHDTHSHPFLPATTGSTGGSFVVPTTGETSTNVWFRIRLTVRDPAGLTHSTFVDIRPRVANLTLASSPVSGLQLTLDGQPVTTPATIPSVVGMTRTLGAPSPQTIGTTAYTFASWSDGGAATHAITVPTSATTTTATFTAGPAGGLRGEYYDNTNFTTLRVTRTDPTVNFDWGSGSPDPSIGVDTFSVRWSGTVTPAFSETYTFFTRTDDGVRLRVNSQLVVNAFFDQGNTERSGSIALTAGQAYPIEMEYYENGGLAVAQLSWQSPSQPKQIIPQQRLTPPTGGGGGGGAGGAGGSGGAGGTGGSSGSGGGGRGGSGGGGRGGSGGSGGSGTTFPIRINFQPAGAPIPAGYLPDTGDLFGPRGTTGLSYGWNINHTDVTRDRGVNADQRLDTLCHFHAAGRWEIALPNGSYSVLVSIGDPSFPSTHTLNVEGLNYWDNLGLLPGSFRSLTRTVTVADGRLTLDQGAAADKSTRINYLEISQP